VLRAPTVPPLLAATVVGHRAATWAGSPSTRAHSARASSTGEGCCGQSFSCTRLHYLVGLCSTHVAVCCRSQHLLESTGGRRWLVEPGTSVPGRGCQLASTALERHSVVHPRKFTSAARASPLSSLRASASAPRDATAWPTCDKGTRGYARASRLEVSEHSRVREWTASWHKTPRICPPRSA
jgi:hypothetical protein